MQPLTFIMIPIPPGKPPKEGSTDRREYKGQKGDGNCFLYSARIMTQLPVSELKEHTRDNLSAHRKRITNLEDTWWKRATTLNTITAVASIRRFPLNDSPQSKQNVVQYREKILEVIKLSINYREGTENVAQQFLNRFKEQKTINNVVSYDSFLTKKERLINHNLFFMQEKVQTKPLIDQKISAYSTPKWNQLTADDQYHIMHEIFVDYTANAFHLKYSDWKPCQPVDKLISLIQAKGALIVNGFIAKGFATTPPSESEVLPDYKTFGWPNTYQVKPNCSNSHFVIVVGAKKSPNETVYFIDPEDPSKPNEKRIAYQLPYKQFCDLVTDSHGLFVKTPTGYTGVKSELLQYALYKG